MADFARGLHDPAKQPILCDMSKSPDLTHRLLDRVASFITPRAETVGLPTPVPRLTVWTGKQDTQPTPAVFEPMFYAVLRGTKVLTMGVNRFELVPGAVATSSFGLPYTHQLTGAKPGLPYVGISLHLDVDLLTRVVLDMPRRDQRWTCAVAAMDLSGPLGEAFARLVDLLDAPEDIAMLAPLHEAELYYRLLQSPMGATLRQIGLHNERFLQLKAAADWLATNYSAPVVIPDLAVSAGMSATSFHRHFKAVTGFSPLAFQRQIRLLEAQKLLAAGSVNVSQAAYKVGYHSPAQFSRDYKSTFGNAPVDDRQQ